MAENSKIVWTDHTFNPWEGCQKVGPGCDHCYAEARNTRFGGGVAVNWGPGAPRRRTSAANWRKPLQWERDAAAFLSAHGRRQRVFCASLADVFDNAVPGEWRRDLFALIYATPHLDWLLLTKRVGNAHNLAMAANWPLPWPRNVWLGATVVNQAEADRDIPKLLATPARMRFLSVEPMLGPVDLTPWLHCYRKLNCDYCDGRRINWVICGGESGPGARPMHPDWARSLRDQCAAAGVPFLFKQWGEWAPGSDRSWNGSAISWDGDVAADGANRFDYPPDATSADRWAMVHRAGKKAAGRLLDGVEHNGFPS